MICVFIIFYIDLLMIIWCRFLEGVKEKLIFLLKNLIGMVFYKCIKGMLGLFKLNEEVNKWIILFVW